MLLPLFCVWRLAVICIGLIYKGKIFLLISPYLLAAVGLGGAGSRSGLVSKGIASRDGWL
ncbi:hypothetical protein RA280_14815 [Cupriavidus sp. CV2]|uniref:hypothetical protein n=1 Tax=Cupriavidus ulmosensis TaxID=3065913 RepID=UPI00296AE958|nr:hypothetical protein [Cupriavidus sp. CV2]MDW3682997.1 hypothetical protein [Cupriavidus sp. CV2]